MIKGSRKSIQNAINSQPPEVRALLWEAAYRLAADGTYRIFRADNEAEAVAGALWTIMAPMLDPAVKQVDSSGQEDEPTEEPADPEEAGPELSEAAKAVRREYYREYYKKNKEKREKDKEAYWERKAKADQPEKTGEAKQMSIPLVSVSDYQMDVFNKLREQQQPVTPRELGVIVRDAGIPGMRKGKDKTKAMNSVLHTLVKAGLARKCGKKGASCLYEAI